MGQNLIYGIGPDGKMVPVKVDAQGIVQTNGVGGNGNGNGGPATVADGADITQGAIADAAVAAGAAGSASAKLRRLTTDVGAQLALVGAVVEQVPATDTASSGLNGRLQRIAQRLTALIAQLPVSLGAKTASASLSVVPATDAVFTFSSSPGVPTNRSGQIAAAGVAQQLAPANAARRGYWIYNVSANDLWVNDVGTATAASPSLRLRPDEMYESPPSAAGVGAISIIGSVSGQTFIAREY